MPQLPPAAAYACVDIMPTFFTVSSDTSDLLIFRQQAVRRTEQVPERQRLQA